MDKLSTTFKLLKTTIFYIGHCILFIFTSHFVRWINKYQRETNVICVYIYIYIYIKIKRWWNASGNTQQWSILFLLRVVLRKIRPMVSRTIRCVKCICTYTIIIISLCNTRDTIRNIFRRKKKKKKNNYTHRPNY